MITTGVLCTVCGAQVYLYIYVIVISKNFRSHFPNPFSVNGVH